MEITLKRSGTESGPDYTHGRLFTDEGGFFCWTLEDTDRGLDSSMSEEEIKEKKKYGITAIPKGRYRIYMRVSPSLGEKEYAKPYGGRFPVLINVPGFSGVMIHPGTNVESTKGCVLVGMLRGSIRGRLFDSQKAYRDLMDFYIWPAYQRKEQIWITIE